MIVSDTSVNSNNSSNISNLYSSGSNVSLENPIRPPSSNFSNASIIPDIEMTDLSRNISSDNVSIDNEMNRIHEGSCYNDIKQAD